MRSRGYSFQEEILYWCQKVGCRIGETPILFENRRAGSSKINMREAASALWILLRLGVSRPAGPARARKRRPAGQCMPCDIQTISSLAHSHVHFLASLGDFLAQALVLAFELAGVHSEHLAQERAMAGVGLALELFERILDLIGQIEQELGLSLDVGQRSLELDAWRPSSFGLREPVGWVGRRGGSSPSRGPARLSIPFFAEFMAGLPHRANLPIRRRLPRGPRTRRRPDACSGFRSADWPHASRPTA